MYLRHLEPHLSEDTCATLDATSELLVIYLLGVKSPLFVRERALLVSGVVKTVFEGVFPF